MSKNSRELKVRYHGDGDKPKRKKNPNTADVSRMGYRDDSPYRTLPYIDIHTPNGTIDMSATGIPLWANGRILPPYSGIHQFDTTQVKEIPLAKQGGWLGKYQAGGQKRPAKYRVTYSDIEKRRNQQPFSYDSNDLFYSDAEYEDDKTTIANRVNECKTNHCLQTANLWYNKFVAKNLNAPSSWDELEYSGVSSTEDNTYDSWDIHGLDKRKILYNRNAYKDKYAAPKAEDAWKDLNLPIGAIIGYGEHGVNFLKAGDTSLNAKKGLPVAGHSGRVVAFDRETGEPWVFDSVNGLKKISKNQYSPITVISVDDRIAQNTYGNLLKGKLNTGKSTPIDIEWDDFIDYDGQVVSWDKDEYEPFMQAYVDNKPKWQGILGLGDDDYDEYTKIAGALAISESEGGNDNSWRTDYGIPLPGYTLDKMGFTNSSGITQLNKDVVRNLFKKYPEMLLRYGLYENEGKFMRSDTRRKGDRVYDFSNPDPQDAAFLTMLLLKSNKPYAEKLYKEGKTNNPNLTDAEKQWYTWNQQSTLKKGEAQGDAIMLKKFRNAYNNIRIVRPQSKLAEKKQAGGLVSFMKSGGSIPDEFRYQVGGALRKALGAARKAAAKPKSSGSAHLREMVKMKQSGVNMEDFFEQLGWASAGRSLWNNIKRQGAKVLTGGQELGPDASAISAGKRKWTAKNLGIPESDVFVETQKAKYAHPNAILIDDLPKNVDSFRNAGGKAILHQTGNKKKTLNELNNLLSKNPNAQIYTDLDGVLVDLQGGVRKYNKQAPKGVVPRREQGGSKLPSHLPEAYKQGGPLKKKQFGGGSAYYPQADYIYISPEDANDPAIYEHEAFHRHQNMDLDSLRIPDYYPGPLRRPQSPSSEDLVSDYWNRRSIDRELMEQEFMSDPTNASFQFVPYDMMYNYVYNPMMYDMPWTAEGEAMQAENAFRDKHQSELVPGPMMYKKGGWLKSYQPGGPTVTRGILQPDNTVMPYYNLPEINITGEKEEDWSDDIYKAALGVLPFATEMGAELAIEGLLGRFPAAKKRLKKFFGRKSKEAAEKVAEEITKGSRKFNMQQSNAAAQPPSVDLSSSGSQSSMPAPGGGGTPTPEPPRQNRQVKKISDLDRNERETLFGQGSVSGVENAIEKELVKFGIVRKTEWQRKDNPNSTKRIPKNVSDFITNNNLGPRARAILDRLENRGLTMDYNSPVFNTPDGLVNAFDYAEKMMNGVDPKDIVTRDYILKNMLGDNTVNELRKEIDKIRVLASEPDIVQSLGKGETKYKDLAPNKQLKKRLDKDKYKTTIDVTVGSGRIIPVYANGNRVPFMTDSNGNWVRDANGDPVYDPAEIAKPGTRYAYMDGDQGVMRLQDMDNGGYLSLTIEPNSNTAGHISFFAGTRNEPDPSDVVAYNRWVKRQQLSSGNLLRAAVDMMPINSNLFENTMSLDSGGMINNMGSQANTPFRLMRPVEYSNEFINDNHVVSMHIHRYGRDTDLIPTSRINAMAKLSPQVQNFQTFNNQNSNAVSRNNGGIAAGISVQNSVLESANSMFDSQLQQGLIDKKTYDANVTLWHVDPFDHSKGFTTKAPDPKAISDQMRTSLSQEQINNMTPAESFSFLVPAKRPGHADFNIDKRPFGARVFSVYDVATDDIMLDAWINGHGILSDSFTNQRLGLPSSARIDMANVDLFHFNPAYRKEFKKKGGQINTKKKYQFGGGTGPIGSFGANRDWVRESMRRDIDASRENKARQAAVLYDNMQKTYTAEPASTDVKYQPVKAARPGEDAGLLSDMFSSSYLATMLPVIGQVAVEQGLGAIPKVGKRLQKAFRQSKLDENIASARGYDIPYSVERNLYKTGIVRKGEAAKPFKIENPTIAFSDAAEELEVKTIIEKMNSQGLELDMSNPIFKNKRGDNKKNTVLEALNTVDDIFHGDSQSSNVARKYLEDISSKPDMMAARNMLSKQRGYDSFAENPARRSKYSAYHMSEDGDFVEFNTKSMGTKIEFTNAMGEPEMHVRLDRRGNTDDVRFKLNVERLPNDNLLYSGMDLRYVGSNTGRQRAEDIYKVVETAKGTAPKDSYFMEGSLSTDSYPMAWDFARRKNTPFRIITPRDWVGGLDQLNLFNRGHMTTLAPDLGEKVFDVLPVQRGNGMGKENKYAKTKQLLDGINDVDDDATMIARNDNYTIGEALKLQNHNVEVANKGLKEQYENGLISKDVFDANTTMWLENPKDPNSRLVTKAPQVNIDDLMNMSAQERRMYLPQKTPLHTAFSMNKPFVNRTQRQTSTPVYNYWHLISDDNLLNAWRNDFNMKAETWMITPGFIKEYKKGGSTTNWLGKYK